MLSKTTRALLLSLFASGAACANANPIIGSQLEQMMPTLTGKVKVIVSTHQRDQLDAVMSNLNIPYLAMSTLPMAGASLSKTQLESMAKDERVKSIYFDAPVDYYNFTSGEITQGHYVHDVEGVTGVGTTIAVLDSGVDATHPDLTLGDKVVQNIKIAGDLDFAGGKNLFIEGLPNSDTTSGHGTHVAGTVAGSGAASANDSRRAFYHDGIAPNAKLVGIGAGDGVSILYSIAGFDYAIANSERYDIDVITNSWGGGDGNNFDPNNPVNQASYAAYKKGIVVTFAASNSGPDNNTLNQYAVAPWVINVAAGTNVKGLADFSSRGVEGDKIKQPDITAPGSGIISTRAVNTALPAIGPVIDTTHPDYHIYYARMSGTSMATPFVAGVVGLLLEVNPQLSPDQIEEIIKVTAEPMPDYKTHEVGAGYINVKAAVDLAKNIQGKRGEFLLGDTAYSSQGDWNIIAETDQYVDYVSNWSLKSDASASDGVYLESKRRRAQLLFNFVGETLQVNYIAHPNGGHASVMINGVNQGVIDFYSPTKTNKSYVVSNLDGKVVNAVSIKRMNGKINIDGFKTDGFMVDNGLSIINEQQIITGNIGPSAENIQANDHLIKVTDNTTAINASLSWPGVADLDFQLINPQGEVVASSASLENPEVIDFRPDSGGDYLLRVNGYISVNTNYEIDLEVSSVNQ
ncbi:S8 family serine peptidase [Aliikangiella sp. IMCC44632]